MRKLSIAPEPPNAATHTPPRAPSPAPSSPLGVIAGAEAPPFRIPGIHFGAALLFFVLGGAGLIWVAPELAAGAFLSPRVTAVTHLFTLGWITTSIMGALYQLFPVLLGRQVRWIGVTDATLATWVPGILFFVAGLALQDSRLIVLGAGFLSAAILLFSVNLGASLAGAPRKDLTWWALSSAGVFLLLTMVVGAALATNLRWPFMGAGRISILGTHLHMALVGWVLMVVVGVGHRLLPMFLLSHDAPTGWGKLSVALLASGTGLLFAVHHMANPLARLVPPLLMAAGTGAFLIQALAFFHTRKRPRLDAGMRMAGAGLVLLAAGATLGGWLFLTSFTRPVLATAYVTTLVLALSLFVAGHQYKILPFLVWFHRFGPLAGRERVPTVSELYSARLAGIAAVLLVVGAYGVCLSVALGASFLARPAAGLFAGGALTEALQLAGVARRRPA